VPRSAASSTPPHLDVLHEDHAARAGRGEHGGHATAGIGLVGQNAPCEHDVEVAQAGVDTEVIEPAKPERGRRAEVGAPRGRGLHDFVVDVDADGTDAASREARGDVADATAHVHEPRHVDGAAAFEELLGRRPEEPRDQLEAITCCRAAPDHIRRVISHGAAQLGLMRRCRASARLASPATKVQRCSTPVISGEQRSPARDDRDEYQRCVERATSRDIGEHLEILGERGAILARSSRDDRAQWQARWTGALSGVVGIPGGDHHGVGADLWFGYAE